MSQQLIRVVGANRLRPGQSLRFDFTRGALKLEGFVLRSGDGVAAFVNSCPHWSVDLDLGTGEFYDEKLDRIVCRNHGALFDPKSGACDWGPCTGHSLERFEVELDADDVVVRVPGS